MATRDEASAELEETSQGDADWKNKRIKLKTQEWARSQGGRLYSKSDRQPQIGFEGSHYHIRICKARSSLCGECITKYFPNLLNQKHQKEA